MNIAHPSIEHLAAAAADETHPFVGRARALARAGSKCRCEECDAMEKRRKNNGVYP